MIGILWLVCSIITIGLLITVPATVVVAEVRSWFRPSVNVCTYLNGREIDRKVEKW